MYSSAVDPRVWAPRWWDLGVLVSSEVGAEGERGRRGFSWAPQGWVRRMGSPDGVGPRLVDPRIFVGPR